MSGSKPMDNREREALRELTEAARGFIDGKPKTLRRLRNATTEAERALAEARAAIEGESRDSKCQVPVRENSKALIEKWRTAKNLSSDPARAMTYGYCADELEGVVTGLMGLVKLMRESTHPDAVVREQLKAAANLMEEIVGGRAERVLEAAGLPEQRELTPDEQKNLRGVYDKLYRKAAAAPLPTAREPQVFGWNIEQILVYIWQCMSEGDDEEANPWPFSTFSVSPMAARLRSEIAALAAPQPVSEARLREALEAVIAADDIGLNTQMDPKFAAQFQKAARLCAAALESA